ncbi:MAG: Omp28-related outer membrane protein [Saprospiraceae bacterium]|nr:Omp28-related outer membrane protein [Saprospiraceae bacterium]
MKKVYLLLLLILPFIAEAQYAKYGLVEWFTNTYCGICSSRNPALQSVYDQHAQNLHRITIHPSVPYQQCSLYNFNTEDNGARQSYYNVGATPTLYLNGIRTSSSSSAFSNDIANLAGQTSPISLEVEEGLGTAIITVKAAGDVPAGSYRIMVALLEKKLDFNAPNGETEHYDVLRDFISAAEGDEITMPAAGTSLTLNYNYSVPSGVNPSEAYILAYIQNIESNEILNSGTRFDEASTALTDLAIESDLRTFPNPATSQLNISVGNDYRIHGFQVFNHVGQRLKSAQLNVAEARYTIDIEDLPIGAYLINVDLGEENAAIRFVKE